MLRYEGEKLGFKMKFFRLAWVVITLLTRGTLAQEVSAPVGSSGTPDLPIGLNSALSVRVNYVSRLQWYFEGVAVPGATNQLLWFHPVTPKHAGRYFVVGFGANLSLPAVTGQTAVVTVKTVRPTIMELGPALHDNGLGNPILLTLKVGGAPPPAVQWYMNGRALTGETNSSLFFPRATTELAGRYHAVATNEAGADFSEAFLVTARSAPPVWLRPSEDKEEVEGNAAVLSAVASGSPPPQFRWRKDGKDLPFQTNATLLLSGVRAEDAGSYEVIASNDAGEIRAAHGLTVQASNGLDRWVWREPRPQGSGLLTLARGKDRWVAAGNLGAVVVRKDGGTWEATRIPGDITTTQLLYAEGQFIGFGFLSQNPLNPRVLLTSPDGFDWTVTHWPDLWAAPTKMAHGGGRFVATSSSPLVFTHVSTDGLRWVPQDARPFGGVDVAWGNGRFVVSDLGGRLHASKDGETWEVVLEVAGSGSAGLQFAGGRFIASFDNCAAISEDGLHWSLFDPHPAYRTASMAFGNGAFVAASGQNGFVTISKDAVLWTSRFVFDPLAVRAVGFEQGEFVAVGEGGLIATSSDGAGWLKRPAVNKENLMAVTATERLLVAVGKNGTILTSTNGQTWNPQAAPTGKDLYSVAHGAGLFMAGGDDGIILTSKEGLIWTRTVRAMPDQAVRVRYMDGRWVALGQSMGYATSVDGGSWSLAPGAAASFADLSGLASGNGVWVLSSRKSRVPLRYSVDGKEWTPADFAFSGEGGVEDVAFGNGLFVAAARAGWVVTSTNGMHWTQRSAPRMVRLTYAAGLFLGTDPLGRVCSSTDGIRWAVHRTAKGQVMNDIVPWRDGTVIVVGNNGSIQQSADIRSLLDGVAIQGGDLVLDIRPGPYEGRLRVEMSSDLREWRLMPGLVGQTFKLPVSPALQSRFFRLVIP